MANEKPWNRFPIPGVEIWKNPKNRFVIFQLHYSADDRKRDPAYRQIIKSAMPLKDYMQEYELNWDSYSGTPVFEDWQLQMHGSKEKLHPEFGLPLMRGWDFGLTPAVVICQYTNEQLKVLKEYTAINMGIDRFTDYVLPQIARDYPRWARKEDWIDMIDPAGFGKVQTNEDTCAMVMGRKGLGPIAGPVGWEKRRKAVEYFLTRVTKHGPGMLVDLAGCPVLTRGFNGGYRYPEKVFDREPKEIRPLKDEHSHPQDALQYVCWKVQHYVPYIPGMIPSPQYSFSRGPSDPTERRGGVE